MTQDHDPRGWNKVISSTIATSPFYHHLDQCMKLDPEIQSLRDGIDKNQPNLILFGAGVNFLVFENPQTELAAFYHYLTTHPRPIKELYPVYRSFCLEHADALRQLLAGARLQTNSVGRCSYLVPALQQISALTSSRPLYLIEIGCSAGLNLNLDHYGYYYNDQFATGDLASPVQLRCAVDGRIPTLSKTMPSIAEKIGIELFPLDIFNERDVRWLRACIWPDQLQRYHDFDAALALAKQYPPRVVAGDACEQLPGLLEMVPLDTTLCIINSFSLNQGPSQIKERIEEIIADRSWKRTIHRLSLEVQPPDRPWPWLELDLYWQGKHFLPTERLATCTLHGEHMHWHSAF